MVCLSQDFLVYTQQQAMSILCQPAIKLKWTELADFDAVDLI